jgi:hypothetical protein
MATIARRLVPSEEGAAVPFQIGVTVTAGQTFTLPIADYGSLVPNFVVNWGDGNESTVTSSTDADRIHTYASSGTYTITISGLMPSFKVNNNSAIRLLITSIIDFGRVGLRLLDFYGCSSITSIPASGTMAAGYQGLNEIVSFAGFMRGTSISTIPSDLFQYATRVSIFSDIFSFTTITSIPSGLFDNCADATSFASAFNQCTSLSSYPLDLFDNCPNVVNFSSTFRNCRLLTAPLQFTNNTAVTVFTNVYNMISSTNSMAGTAPEIWLRIPAPVGTAAFRNCTGLSNFASIPSNFK